MEEMNSLLRSPVVAYGRGSLIVRRATKIKQVFFLLAGGVERSNGIRPEQTLPSGSLIDVGALVDEESDATWRATSPMRLLRINGYTFRSFFLNFSQWRLVWLATHRSRGHRISSYDATFYFHLNVAELGRIARERRLLALNANAIADNWVQFLRLFQSGALQLPAG